MENHNNRKLFIKTGLFGEAWAMLRLFTEMACFVDMKENQG